MKNSLNLGVQVRVGCGASKGASGSRFRLFCDLLGFASVAIFAGGSGCTRALDASIATLSPSSVAPNWQVPITADLLSIFASAPTDACSMDSDGAGAIYSAGQFQSSFSSFRITRTATSGLLVAGVGLVSGGTSHRIFSQVYSPGKGLDSLPVESRFLDSLTVTSHYRDLFAASSVSGEFLAGGFQPLGSLRGASWVEAQGWSLTPQTTAGSDHRNSQAALSTTLGENDFGHDLSNGWSTDAAIANDGWALAVYPSTSTTSVKVRGFTAADSWDTANALFSKTLQMGVSGGGSGSLRQSIALADGLGVTVLWSQRVTVAATSCFEVRSAWFTEAPGGATWNTSATDAQSLSCSSANADSANQSCASVTACDAPMKASTSEDFATTSAHSPINAATDGNGTVVVVYYATDPTFPGSTACSATGCKVRLFASVRGADGIWIGPTQVDENLLARRTSTSYFQQSMDTTTTTNVSAGGVMLPTPGLVHLGGGRFLLASAINDLTTSGAYKTRIFSRTFQVGSGWALSSEVQELTSNFLLFDSSFTSNPGFRKVQDLSLSSDGAGNALLAISLVIPRGGHFQDQTNTGGFQAASGRAVVPAHSFYRAGAWEELVSFGDWVPCPLTATDSTLVPTACNSTVYRSLFFPSGHALLFTPQPISSSSTKLQLYVSEYIPEGGAP